MGIDKPLDDIDFDDIDSLIKSGQIEFTTVEFKAELTDDNFELAKDLTAFANTDGGDIIYGVKQIQDATGKHYEICGVEKSNVDSFIQRVNQIARDRCFPPLKTYECSLTIDMPSQPNRCLFIVRVHSSLAAPHSCHLKLPVYVRRTNINDSINIVELRDVLDFQTTLVERAAGWRAERLSDLAVGNLPGNMRMGYFHYHNSLFNSDLVTWDMRKQLFVVHFMPLVSFKSAPSIDTVASGPHAHPLPLLFADHRFLTAPIIPMRDGVLSHLVTGATPISYTMLFRSGTLELVSPNILAPRELPTLRPDLYQISGSTTTVLKTCIELYKKREIPPPILLGFRLSGIRNFEIPRWSDSTENKLQENDITSVEYRLDDYDVDIDALFGHFLNVVANAAGQWKFNRSPAAS